MKEILRITFALTLSCLIAATVMGFAFTITNEAKKRNEHRNVQQTMLGLLGYSKSNPPPSDLELYPVYRYILEQGESKHLGYMVPVKRDDAVLYDLVMLTLEGAFFQRHQLEITPEEALEESERSAALEPALGADTTFTYADSAIVAIRGDQRLAYLLPAEFPGFKTFIHAMLALKPNFTILGLEIVEHEEDPGLGGDIERPYFKNQFEDVKFQDVKDFQVVKKPMPEKYREYLEAEKNRDALFSKEEIQNIRETYQDEEIYSLTGATISSQAVTSGVKNAVKKFAYRIQTLDQVLKQQDIPVAF
jgi:electron transport complex protein RnfG